MTIEKYIQSRGLTVRLVSQKLGISRQAVSQYGKEFIPTAKTLEKLAKALTELGAQTTDVDLVQALYDNKK